MKRVISAQKRKTQTQARKARAQKAAQQARLVRIELEAFVTSGNLAQPPHPSFSDKTLHDYAEWMLHRAGAIGQRTALNIVRKAMAR